MAGSGTSAWPNLLAGRKAKASDVESKFDWSEGHLWPHLGGTVADVTYDLGATGSSWRKGIINSITATYIKVTSLTVTDIRATAYQGTVSADEFHFSATTRYYAVAPSDFVPLNNAQIWIHGGSSISPNDGSTTVILFGGVHLPHGAIVTQVTGWWYRANSEASGYFYLQRHAYTGAVGTIASCHTNDSSTSGGWHGITDTSIDNATIDNQTYQYYARLTLNPTSTGSAIAFRGAEVQYTITAPLP